MLTSLPSKKVEFGGFCVVAGAMVRARTGRDYIEA
jgi:hypothetical protein